MEPLDYTDNGDDTVTLNNDPAPDDVTIPRVPWQDMVSGALPWATVTEEPENPEDPESLPIQVLTITGTNVNAVFRWVTTLPGRTTLLHTSSWVTV